MPVAEPTVLAADHYSLRLVGPVADIWPESPATPTTVLARDDMVAYPLPSSPLPTSPDLCTGSYTTRLGDSAEATLTFPNVVASDGVPWRERFDPTGHKQFVEIYHNDELESVGVIDQIPTIDQTQVQIHTADGWWMGKKAYVRDWIVTQSPRDVIERGTKMWVPAIADDFPARSLNPSWGEGGGGSYSISIGATGGLTLEVASGGTAVVAQTATVPSTGTWSASASVQTYNIDPNCLFGIEISESSGDEYYLWLGNGAATFLVYGAGSVSSVSSSISANITYSLSLESDGMWVWAFVNGQLIGCLRRNAAATTSLTVALNMIGASGSSGTGVFSDVFVRSLEPFMMRGSDKGDYVLPGDATTYPYGGLTARYFNDSDVTVDSEAEYLSQVLAPSRTQAYLGSGGYEYMDQNDPQIAEQPPPGFTASGPGPGSSALPYWSCVWFGSIWLELGQGSYVLQVYLPEATPIRVWVGQTQFGQQLVDSWGLGVGGYIDFTVSATTLAGTLPYGGGTVARSGWYPIKIEYAVLGSASTAPGLFWKTIPVSYTDPGGTPQGAGTFSDGEYIVNSTSLSPLGCVDQRYQGIAHYDLVQQTVQAYGYQASVEPKQLESGLFPGVLAPRIREGHDTDIILQPDRGPRQDGENILNYSSGLDATDFASSLWGNGAGLQNGNTGQLQAQVFDVPTMLDSLFDSQQWQDFSDASSPQLLEALLNSQLGLQLAPWQILSADPSGRPRQAYTWPLPGEIAAMRWCPGDGLQIHAADINVWDTTPRQILTFTRNLLPLGIPSSQASFAERPKTQAKVLKQQLFKATRWARNYQRQLVQLTGTYFAAGIEPGVLGGYSIVSLSPGDTVVQAWVRINANSAGMPLQLNINGSDFGGALTSVPALINIMSVAVPEVSYGSRLIAAITNVGGSASDVDYQILLTVLR